MDSLYRQPTVVNRAPDAAGLAYWSGQVSSGARSRYAVAGAFVVSREAALNNGFRAYLAVFYRFPTVSERAGDADVYQRLRGDYLWLVGQELTRRI